MYLLYIAFMHLNMLLRYFGQVEFCTHLKLSKYKDRVQLITAHKTTKSITFRFKGGAVVWWAYSSSISLTAPRVDGLPPGLGSLSFVCEK